MSKWKTYKPEDFKKTHILSGDREVNLEGATLFIIRYKNIHQDRNDLYIKLFDVGKVQSIDDRGYLNITIYNTKGQSIAHLDEYKRNNVVYLRDITEEIKHPKQGETYYEYSIN